MRSVSWILFGNCLSQGLTLSAGILVARSLGVQQYGRLAAIQSTVGAMGIFAGLGLGVTATKHIAELRRDSPERAGRIAAMCLAVCIVAGLAIAFVVFACGAYLAEKSLNDRELGGYLRLGSALALFNGIAGVQAGIFAGMEAFRDIARTNIWKGIASVPLLLIGVHFAALSGAVIALLTTAILSVIFNHAVMRKYRLLRYRNVFSERAVLWKFSVPAFLAGVLVAPVLWIGSVLLLQSRNGYIQLGLFNAANQWRTAVIFLPGIIGQAVLPLLSEVFGMGLMRRFYKIIAINMVVTVSISAICVAAILVGEPLIIRAYGTGYEAISAPLLLMLVSTVISACASVVGQALVSADQMWAGFWLNCLWAAVFILSCLFLAPNQGAIGLAKAFLIAYSAHCLSVTLYSCLTLQSRKEHLQDALTLTA